MFDCPNVRITAIDIHRFCDISLSVVYLLWFMRHSVGVREDCTGIPFHITFRITGMSFVK